MADNTIGISEEAVKKLGQDTSKLHLIFLLTRPGVRLFVTKMEYTYFAPRSGKNNLFDMILSRWPPGMEMMYGICSFPIEYRPQAEALISECGLRLADGIPHMFGDGTVHEFPLDGETVFTLENMSGHSVYENQDEEALREAENAACDAIVMADRIKYTQELQSQGYTAEQIKRMYDHWEAGEVYYDEKPLGVKDGSHRHGKTSKRS